MMLQLNPTIDVKTPEGNAEAIVIIDYGVNVNSVWLCRMKGGKVLHFYSDDILIYDNPMNGNGWDIEQHELGNIINKKLICECDGCKKKGENGFTDKGLLKFFPTVSGYLCTACWNIFLGKYL